MSLGSRVAVLLAIVFLTACGGGGGSTSAGPTSNTTTGNAPGAPFDVSATGGNGQVVVSWFMRTDATSFNIYYGVAPGVTKSNSTKIAGAKSGHVITGLTNGTTYYVAVSSTNSNGEGALSSEMPVNVVAPPVAPAGVAATPADAQITLNWTSVSGASFYTVYYSTTPGVDIATASNVSLWPGRAVTGLTNGTTYYLVVAATNGSGRGALSAEVSATPTLATLAPDAPSGVTADTGGTGNAVLKWAPVPGATTYNAYYHTTTGVNSTTYTAVYRNVDSGTYLGGLTNGNSYYFVVTAENAIGESAISNEVSVVPSAQMGGGIQNPLAIAATATVATATSAASSAGAYTAPVGAASDGPNLYFADKGTGHLFKMVVATNVVTPFSVLPCTCEITDLTTDGKALYVLAVSASDGDKIFRVDMTGTATVFAGSRRAFADLQGTSAAFNNPQGITTDGVYLYVADTGNNLIREVEISTANVRTIAGDNMNLQPGQGDGIRSTFNAPHGITTDGTDIYVADTGNNAIRKISQFGIIFVDTVAGDVTSGTPGSTDGPGQDARFSSPKGITSDGTNIYVTDTGNHRIRMIAPDSTVSTMAGSVQGAGDGVGGLFNQPGAITTDGSSLFVVDSGNTAIRKLQ